MQTCAPGVGGLSQRREKTPTLARVSGETVWFLT
jgi:hypothetical protein